MASFSVEVLVVAWSLIQRTIQGPRFRERALPQHCIKLKSDCGWANSLTFSMRCLCASKVSRTVADV